MHKPTSSISAAESRTYTISELAREFGVTPRALRFYEDKDMLHPARDGMMRLYSNRDRARLTIIVRLKRLGLPLADIREILDLYALNDGKRAQTRMMLEKFRKQARELEVQRQDIDTALTELYKGIDWLQGIVENPGPSEETKRQAAAYEQVARKQLDEV
ncbi:MerR family transcriptional regulator [Hyphomonas sp. NPDC076900]|jgi:DNA-binding transcriptional MerR regulator|uniref:MerR family transcriptional regulator n=1 Tax=Hyphomonas polymorpha PS728 TaxID=1280954 RepID=A0A062VQC3_9PROT|nr:MULTISPECIES: MerR family DNA-binding transcriptional regulator [Hyphomonas]AXE63271.1 transcriptional regulator [Hyphomonas sp. CACIAM 19H1]KDA00494.1 MerR family transcriptional regulator [Hyphomonas polymorpha PS728]MBA4227850.1 MerR family DNA-binding transcriptional regulator [Hyphomonas sp.]MBY9065372.1 MerR family DNA-binding transcriptional regulator [Hyphomonas sediminis]